MAESRNRSFAKLAKDVDTSGNIVATGISSSVSLGATIYATRANLPSSGNTAGDQAFTTDTNRLYIWNGSGWYNIALLNVAPSIQSVLDSDSGTTPFSLAIDGTPTTITITATDSDGDPLTYEYSADSDFAGLATLSQADNVFTITPFSQDSATTESGTITFTATDGINTASSGVQTFTLEFADWTAMTQQTRLIASDYAEFDKFGEDVAIDGDIAVVGQHARAQDNLNDNGSAYVFTRSGSTWTQRQILTASDAGPNDEFGGYVSISGDTIIVGAEKYDYAGTDAGAAYAFVTSDGGLTWTQQKLFRGDTYTNYDYFGINDIDGDTVVFGARGKEISSVYDHGAAYVYTRSGTTWTKQVDLHTVATGLGESSQFGKSVSISGDTIAIGTSSSGTYIFTRSGTTWTQQQIISAQSSILDIDGDDLLIGTSIYTRSGSTWTLQQTLTGGTGFGSAGRISNGTVIIGASTETSGSTESGKGYVYTRSGTTWSLADEIQGSGYLFYARQGTSVAIDGSTILLGAQWQRYPDNGANEGVGLVHVFVAG